VGTRHAIYAIVASLWHGGMAVFRGKWDASPEIVNIHATKPQNGMACRAKWETGAKVDAKTVNAVTSWGIASRIPMLYHPSQSTSKPERSPAHDHAIHFRRSRYLSSLEGLGDTRRHADR
jgi:hypothetical protein